MRKTGGKSRHESTEMSPSTAMLRQVTKDRRKLFCGVDSSTERDNEEGERANGEEHNNAAVEYSLSHVDKAGRGAKPSERSKARGMQSPSGQLLQGSSYGAGGAGSYFQGSDGSP